MCLTELFDLLKTAGYSPYIHEDRHTLYCCITDEAGKPRFETMCRIRIENEKYTCMYFGDEHDTKIILGSGAELVGFIKKQFPVSAQHKL